MIDEDDIDLNNSDLTDREELREYGRNLALDAILRESYHSSNLVNQETSRLVKGSVIYGAGHKPVRSSKKSAFWSVAGIAALLFLLITISLIVLSDTNEPLEQISKKITVEPLTPMGVTVAKRSGRIIFKNKSGSVIDVSLNDLIPSNTSVETGENASLQLSYSDGSRIDVNEKTEFETASSSAFINGKKLKLVAGKLAVSISPQKEGEQFYIQAPLADVFVLGTEFDLTASESRTQLDVREGTVSFENSSTGEKVLVLAGQSSAFEDKSPKTSEKASVAEIESFSLISIKTGEVVSGFDPIPDGAEVSIQQIPGREFTIVANTKGRVKQVEFSRSDHPEILLELFSPFAAAGDNPNIPDSYNPMQVTGGKVSVTAIPFDRDGQKGEKKSITIKIVR